MKNPGPLFLLLIVVTVSGCASFGSVLDKDRTTSLTHIYIIPFKGASFNKAHCGFCNDYDGASLNINGMELSIEVAEKTKQYLKTAYNYSIAIAPEVAQFPGIEAREKYYSSWNTSLNNWFNEDTSSIDYSEQPDSDTVLEIIVPDASSWPYHQNFWMKIRMKLVDTPSRTVLAKAKCMQPWPSIIFTDFIPVVDAFVRMARKNYHTSFSGTGVSFKWVFLKAAENTIPECIEALGLRKKKIFGLNLKVRFWHTANILNTNSWWGRTVVLRLKR